MKSRILFILAACLLAGCNALAPATPTPTQTATAIPPSKTPTPIPSATPSPTVTPTSAPQARPTPTWVVQGPDAVNVPILLYHHIAVSPIGSRYYVPPDTFDSELKLLHDWGYTTITTSMLVEAITKGAALPPHPMLITFDDSNEDNYTNAFPIMQKYGFTGVLYVVVQYLDTPNYLTTDQVRQMADAGWEVGSHSETHIALIGDPEVMRYEIVQSRKDLENLLGLPILTFAYPFGAEDSTSGDYVHFGGYIAAMGANGYSWGQGKNNLFMLQRCEIKGSDTVRSFTRFLPWLGDPSFLPTITTTPTATPSRTPIPTYTQYSTRVPGSSPTP